MGNTWKGEGLSSISKTLHKDKARKRNGFWLLIPNRVLNPKMMMPRSHVYDSHRNDDNDDVSNKHNNIMTFD